MSSPEIRDFTGYGPVIHPYFRIQPNPIQTGLISLCYPVLSQTLSHSAPLGFISSFQSSLLKTLDPKIPQIQMLFCFE